MKAGEALMAIAKLVPINLNDPDHPTKGTAIDVHFNPQTLKLSYTNNNNHTPQAKAGAVQHLSNPPVRLSLELLFDTTEANTDVRETTRKLAALVVPGTLSGDPDIAAPAKTDTAPFGIEFRWGSLVVAGTIDSMEETLDYFREDGTALRASVSLTITSKDYRFKSSGGQPGAAGGAAGAGASAGFSAGFSAGISGGASASAGFGVSAGFAGTAPLASVQVGASLQGMAGSAGVSADWKSIANANGIDNPLRLQAGASINLNARADVSI